MFVKNLIYSVLEAAALYTSHFVVTAGKRNKFKMDNMLSG